METKIYSRVKKVMSEGGVRLVIQKSLRRLRISYTDFLAHPTPNGLPKTKMEAQIFETASEDVAIAKRIIASARKALADEQVRAKKKSYVDAWDDLKGKAHNELIDLIHANDADRLADFLVNIHTQKMTYGVASSAGEYKEMASSARLRKQRGAVIKDILTSFAEALAILPYETVVPYVAKKNIYADPDYLIREIEKKISITITPPNIEGGAFKLALANGYFDERDFWCLYAAWRINNIVEKKLPVCEIGAGVGKVALYANRFGFGDYSIFDLPLMNVVQAWYLIKGVPDKKIVLYGEHDNSNDSVKIMPYWEFGNSDKRYGIVLNEDSFPEINRDVVRGYLETIKRVAPYFLSINHEHQAPLFPGSHERNSFVPSIVETSGGFKKIYRFPFWLRKGYAEELYEVTK